jgi:hypothetical protein
MRKQPRVKLETLTKKAIGMLKTAAIYSSLNFGNKVRSNQSIFDVLLSSLTQHDTSHFSRPTIAQFIPQVHLLEAEQFSVQDEHSKARASYLAAIDSARNSGFFHEQGLACELAGHHCKNVGDGSGAWNYFDQAKRCYTEWGSQLTVEKITQQLDLLSEYMPVATSSAVLGAS